MTKIRGPKTGRDYSLFAVLDLYSRTIVAWEVVPNENQYTALKLLREAFHAQGIKPGQLKLHSDNGSVMRSEAISKLLKKFKVGNSFSRPGVSNDNPFSESQFKTIKYDRRYPKAFESLEACRTYLEGFFDHYNNDHRHSGLSYCTPASVHCGQADSLIRLRQAVLDKAYEANRAQFGGIRPIAKSVPNAVGINARSAVEKLNKHAA